MTTTQPIREQLLQHPHFAMIEVEGGSFWMGDDESDYSSEKPAHRVQVPSFHIGKYLVTQAIWEMVMGENPAYFKGADRPVEQVSWDQITQEFLPRLNEITGQNYRLPSEAEWEYAARGGKHQSPFRYAGSNKIKEAAWYSLNSHGETKVVGQKLPNELGIYDMSGNVFEWCADHWHENYKDAPQDGTAWIKDGDERIRVVRGGSWNNVGYNARVSDRNWSNTIFRHFTIGFRLAW